MFEFTIRRKKRWYFFEDVNKLVYLELPRFDLCHSRYKQGRNIKGNFIFSMEAYQDIKWSSMRLPNIQ